MSSAIEKTVSAIVETAGVTYRAVYMGECKNAFGGDHTMDKWRCEFIPSSAKRAPQYFDFFTGLGHRVDTAMSKMARGLKYRPGTVAFEMHVTNAMQPVAPSAASVLHCLVSESSAAGQSFESWCDECGYDTDSRKAHQTYMDCQANADKLARVFAPDVIRQLSEAMQEY